MASVADIRTRIERDVFDYQQLVGCLTHLKKPRDKIRRLLAAGAIIRIRKGLYTFGDPFRRGPISRELLANLIHGPSYVSGDYALSYHGLIPERIETVTSATPGRSRTFTTPFGTFAYRSLAVHRYAAGVLLIQSSGISFLIASPEKALADKVWSDRRFRGGRLADFGPYLEEDLRCDVDRLAALDMERLHTIDRAYRSRKISALIRHIAERREHDHA
jgi:hypothetical protein